jgi:hypothetical protein
MSVCDKVFVRGILFKEGGLRWGVQGWEKYLLKIGCKVCLYLTIGKVYFTIKDIKRRKWKKKQKKWVQLKSK